MNFENKCKCIHKNIKQLCRARANRRWCSLLTQKRSRIGHNCGMRERLGEDNWIAFVKYANEFYKDSFVNSLIPSDGLLCCIGRINGEECPHKLNINLNIDSLSEIKEKLPRLHMDHNYDVNQICYVWKNSIPKNPKTWDDGICGNLVAHLLFGTKDNMKNYNTNELWRKQINLRCGNINGVKGQHSYDFCHDLSMAHYNKILHIKDILQSNEKSFWDKIISVVNKISF